MWARMKLADDYDYLMGAGTSGSSDVYLNSCGIRMNHAYSIIAVFEMDSISGFTHRMYMMRDPWAVTDYNADWHAGDSAWSTHFID